MLNVKSIEASGVEPVEALQQQRWRQVTASISALAGRYADGELSRAAVQHGVAAVLAGLDGPPVSAFERAAADRRVAGTSGRWSLYEDARVRIGLLALRRGQSVPPHDRDGAVTVMKVLDGHVVVSHYAQPPAADPGGFTYLDRLSTAWLGPGQVDCVPAGADDGVYALRAAPTPALILEAALPPYESADRVWYLSVQPSSWRTDRMRVVPVRLDGLG